MGSICNGNRKVKDKIQSTDVKADMDDPETLILKLGDRPLASRRDNLRLMIDNLEWLEDESGRSSDSLASCKLKLLECDGEIFRRARNRLMDLQSTSGLS